MKKVIVASTNPVKVQAARHAFERVFPDERFVVEGCVVPSGVSKQPRSDEDTFLGALHRADGGCRQKPDADFWVGMEGGVEGVLTFGWIVVRSSTKVGKAKTAAYPLPALVLGLLEEGYELGQADDLVFGTVDSKWAGGAVGLLTGDLLTRTELYASAVVLALIPFKNPDLY